MPTTKEIGNIGEAMAQRYLIEQGYAILHTNWRKGRHEADIIAYKEGLIVFVEVKTRSSLEYGNPEDFVNRDKQRIYVRLANAYVLEHRRTEEVRFDIIAIENSEDSVRIRHIPGAFSAVGLYLR